MDFTHGYFVVAILFSEHTSLKDKGAVSCFFLRKQICLTQKKQTFNPLSSCKQRADSARTLHGHFTCPHPPSPLGKSTAFPMRTVLPPQQVWEEFLCPCSSFQTLCDAKKMIFVRLKPASWSSALLWGIERVLIGYLLRSPTRRFPPAPPTPALDQLP